MTQPSDVKLDPQTIEAMLALQSKAPRVSLHHIEQLAARIDYRYHQDLTCTFCHAFLKGTFLLATGVSACVNPANYDRGIGEALAKKDAQNQALKELWKLEGYRLWAQI